MKKEKRILGIDYGLARIGLALSDPSQLIATPLQTFKAEKKMEKTVEKLIQKIHLLEKEMNFETEEIVIGYPLLMSGKIGMLADEVRLFSSALKKVIFCPIILWDERLTSVQADRSLRESNLTRKKRAKAVDSVSALILLQNYLDYKNLQKD